MAFWPSAAAEERRWRPDWRGGRRLNAGAGKDTVLSTVVGAGCESVSSAPETEGGTLWSSTMVGGLLGRGCQR